MVGRKSRLAGCSRSSGLFRPATSGTLDFFVEKVFADVGLAEMSQGRFDCDMLTANVSKGVMRRLEREKPYGATNSGLSCGCS